MYIVEIITNRQFAVFVFLRYWFTAMSRYQYYYHAIIVLTVLSFVDPVLLPHIRVFVFYTLFYNNREKAQLDDEFLHRETLKVWNTSPLYSSNEKTHQALVRVRFFCKFISSGL